MIGIMTHQEIEQYFQYHNANMQLLKIGFDTVRDQIKSLYYTTDINDLHTFSLADTDPAKKQIKLAEKSLSRILSGIQVSWAEESIKRLLYEKNLFTDTQRDYLIQISSLDQKWYATLKIVFSIAYDLVPSGDEICDTVKIKKEKKNLGDELVAQYFELRDIITKFLVPNFSIRNKVQHGEWVYAFKPKYSAEFSQRLTDKINHENLITTTSRYTLVNAFYQMIVDMGRFKSNTFALDSMQTPFEYFYKNNMKKIRFEVSKIKTPMMDEYIQDIVDKEIRGRQYRINRQQPNN